MLALRRFVSPLLLAAVPHIASSQQYDPALYAALRWRLIGPFRGGRTVAAAGVPGQPSVFYIGVNDGGVWKTTDYGRTWVPIFDDQPTGSIGALAVAPSDPKVLYVGSGEGLQRPDLSVGDGMYRSSDGGNTWRHLGLAGGQQIPAILVDPRDPNRVFVAVLGHPYGPNEERGVFRSTDGGATWQKVLYKDENAGGVDVVFDPANPQTVFAVLWATRQAPWEIGSSWTLSAGNGLYKSTDGGATWRAVTTGLPGAQDGLGRIGLGVSPSEPARMYAVVGAAKGGGLYRSDDGGERWRLVNADPRLWGRDGDFNEVKVDPKNADVVYVANVVTWKSADGGRTFVGWRGAPGGDDYHRLWINPDDPRIILLAGDQGAVVTVNGGETWSSWYNQPTAQFYHVSTDNGFPYRVYGGQQESGSAGIASRGNDGQITFREWHPVGAEAGKHRGVIYTIAPSFLRQNLIWAGTDDGLIHVTHDGGRTWRDVTPPVLTPWSKVSLMEASHFDTLEAFAAVNRFRLDDLHPHIHRTRDGGKTWTERVEGIPGNEVVNAVREDPARRSLLFAGTERGVHVSFDDGDHWQSLRLNLPATSVRDLVVHDSDLVVATHGRSFWILDDITPLRQIAAAARAGGVYLYRPAVALRVRWNENTDTPLPPDEPAGKNPPDGAVLDYYLPRAAAGSLTLEIVDRTGKLLGRFLSAG